MAMEIDISTGSITVPRIPDLDTDDYEWLRWRNRDKFEFYRKGQQWKEYARELEQFGGEYKKQFPKLETTESWGYSPPPQKGRFRLAQKDEEKIEDLSPDAINARPDRAKIRRCRKIIEKLKEGFGISRLYTFNRSLGVGGFGMTAVVEEYNEDWHKLGEFVVKYNLHEKLTLNHERIMTRILDKAQHAVQLAGIDHNEYIWRTQHTRWNMAVEAEKLGNVARNKPQPVDAIIMSLVPNGDLSTLLKKVETLRLQIPNRVLWSFFLCMTRMCIGMAFPPAEHPRNQMRPYPIMETIPPGVEPRRIVHFDIDPKNILIDRITESDEHTFSPILRLGDFGLTTEVLSEKPDQYYEQMRCFGKLGYLAPEQFAEDWDFLPSNSGKVSKHFLAGNYGVHTNIWGIGKTMENLITGYYFPPGVRPGVLNHMLKEREYVTYGKELIDEPDYGHVDLHMRHLVASCLALMPNDRPNLAELEMFILERLNQNRYAGESDNEILAWFAKLYPEPITREANAARTLVDDDDYDDYDDDNNGDNGNQPPAAIGNELAPSVRAATAHGRPQLWDRMNDPVVRSLAGDSRGNSRRRSDAPSPSSAHLPGPERTQVAAGHTARWDPLRGRGGAASSTNRSTQGSSRNRTAVPDAPRRRGSALNTRPVGGSPRGPPAPSQIAGNLPVYGRAVVPAQDLDVEMADAPEGTLVGGVGAAASANPGSVPRNTQGGGWSTSLWGNNGSSQRP